MQAKIAINRMARLRKMDYKKLFVGNDVKGEVRTEWSSLYQNLHRHTFQIWLNMAQVPTGGVSIEEATDTFTEMFDTMEDWCDANCKGFWSVTDNEDELDDSASEITVEVNMMFELEEDLMRYIKDCALLAKLSH